MTRCNTRPTPRIRRLDGNVYAQLIRNGENGPFGHRFHGAVLEEEKLEFSGQLGTAADIGGITPDAKRQVTVFMKSYIQADPPSKFWESV